MRTLVHPLPRAFMQKLKKKLREERRAATASSTCPVLSLAACACCVELGEGSTSVVWAGCFPPPLSGAGTPGHGSQDLQDSW